MDTFTDIVGTGYHLQEQLVHLKTTTTAEDNRHTPDTLVTDTVTEEAVSGLMLGHTQEIGAQAAQDTPAQTDTPVGTETQDEGTCRSTTKLKASHPTGSDQAAVDHRPPTPEIILEADHHHAAMRSCLDAV